MQNRLLETKFSIPAGRKGIIERPSLLERLQSGLRAGHKLTLVSAPAGYGKTMLVAEWLAQLREVQGSHPPVRFSWLSLEQTDNSPERFLSYFTSALQRANPAIESGFLRLLSLPQLPSLAVVMDELLNELAGIESQIGVIFDDYHLISNPSLHDSVEYFLEHQPEQVHLVITTREDPPFSLARMRARAQMTEIRAHDLRFSLEEAQQFLNQSMQLGLPEVAVRSLETRTEGWVTGLQLAALALQNMADPGQFIETFRGSHRYVFDYLAEEVIRQQGDEIFQFLSKTSILDRFNASLCEAVSGRQDSHQVLQHLEQANLFIVPLDQERSWYRYHHLFADYLQAGLSKSELAELYQIASVWHEENELTFEAVRYALASGEPDFAANAVERAVQKQATWSGGQLTVLAGWLDALPSAALQIRPLLSLHASRIFYLSGRFERAEKLLAQAETAFSEQPLLEEEQRLYRGLISLYRGSLAAARGELQRGWQESTLAAELLSPADFLAHARNHHTYGMLLEYSGQTRPAVEAYLKSSDLAREAGVLFLAINARCAAALVLITLGKLRQAVQVCQQALDLSPGMPIAPHGLAWLIMGYIAYEQNNLTGTEQYLQKGIELARQGGLVDDLNLGMILLARLKLAQGELEDAFDALKKAGTYAQGFGIPRVSGFVAANTARLQLVAGQVEQARQWAEHYQASRGSPPVEYSREFEDITLARFLVDTGQFAAVPPLLGPLLEQAQASGRVRTSIDAMLVQALLHQAQREIPAALLWLENAMFLAAPEGISRVFIDEGRPLADLLPRVHTVAPDLVAHLIASLRPDRQTAAQPESILPDPLTEQELRILQLVAAGKSNQEIADELVISIGTAKWHVHNILQKLGVKNRPQAIARARQLGLD